MRRSLASKLIMGGIEGYSLSASELAVLKKYELRGLTLFKRNIESAEQLIHLNDSLKDIHPKIEIAVDQEGGRVSRLRAFSMPDGSLFPDAGPAGSLSFTQQQWRDYGKQVGTALAALGFTTNFAPVVDVLTNSKNQCIGDRAFAATAGEVASMAGAYLEGQNETLVKSVLKHFPGQGDAEVDTHLGAAVVELSKEELFETHLQPFKQLHAKAQGIMMAHSSYPAVDNLAASLSHTWITDILREEMGYRGLVYSDDFLMHAIPQDPASWREAVVESVAAGTDVILICRHIEKAQEAAEAMIAKMASSQAFTQIVESKRQSV